jgi:hypothetical protein
MKQFLSIVFLFSCVNVFAQQPNGNTPLPPPNQKMANLQGLKIAYITKQLDLSPAEAQKFWPVYYDFIDELKLIRQSNRGNEIASDEAALGVKKKYLTEFKKIFGSDARANKVFTIERDFAAEVKMEYEKRRQMRKQ